jgi:hypothetical protein
MFEDVRIHTEIPKKQVREGRREEARGREEER